MKPPRRGRASDEMKDEARSTRSASRLDELAREAPWPEVRRVVLGNPAVNRQTVALLLRDDDRDVRHAAAENPKVTIAAMRELAASDRVVDREVAAYVAYHKGDAAMLRRLARDKAAKVRLVVAWGTHDGKVLTALAADPSKSVRQRVIWNKHTPDAALARMACDPDQELRDQILGKAHRRPRVTLEPADWEAMAEHPNPDVRADFVTYSPKRFKKLVQQLMQDPSPAVRAISASATKLTPAATADLAKDPSPGMRAVMARKTDDTEVLHLLAHDQDETVALAAIANPLCSAAILGSLATATDKCRRAAYLQPNATVDTFESLRLAKPELLPELIDYWSNAHLDWNKQTQERFTTFEYLVASDIVAGGWDGSFPGLVAAAKEAASHASENDVLLRLGQAYLPDDDNESMRYMFDFADAIEGSSDRRHALRVIRDMEAMDTNAWSGLLQTLESDVWEECYDLVPLPAVRRRGGFDQVGRMVTARLNELGEPAGTLAGDWEGTLEELEETLPHLA